MGNMFSVTNKLLQPSIEHNRLINTMTPNEKIEYIKKKYNLTHGKGRRKHKKK